MYKKKLVLCCIFLYVLKLYNCQEATFPFLFSCRKHEFQLHRSYSQDDVRGEMVSLTFSENGLIGGTANPDSWSTAETRLWYLRIQKSQTNQKIQ